MIQKVVLLANHACSPCSLQAWFPNCVVMYIAYNNPPGSGHGRPDQESEVLRPLYIGSSPVGNISINVLDVMY